MEQAARAIALGADVSSVLSLFVALFITSKVTNIKASIHQTGTKNAGERCDG